MCELRTYLASYKRLYTNAVAMPWVSQLEGISVTIPTRIVLHACVDDKA